MNGNPQSAILTCGGTGNPFGLHCIHHKFSTAATVLWDTGKRPPYLDNMAAGNGLFGSVPLLKMTQSPVELSSLLCIT